MYKFIRYIFFILLFIDAVYPQDNLNQIYHNSALGISFNYDGDIDYPYGFGEHNDTSLSDWKTHISKGNGISFEYPKTLSLRETDSTIYLGYYNKKNESKFYKLITIYFMENSFKEIADEMGFELDLKDSLIWYMPSIDETKAQYKKGYNCQVLRGLASDRFDSEKLGAHSIPNLVIKSLLVFDSDKSSRTIMYYRSKLTYYVDEVGLPEVDVTENDFYIIASTIKFIKK
jgi:hypothetical protein